MRFCVCARCETRRSRVGRTKAERASEQNGFAELAVAHQSKYVRLYSKFYPDKPRVGLQDTFVRDIMILAGGNRGKDD